MSGRLFGYARVSVASDADANNLENQRRVLADCEQVFEDVGSGASWNRTGLNRLKASLRQGDCVKVVALDRLGRSLTEVFGVAGMAARERRRNHQPPGIHRSGQRHGAGDAAPGHRIRRDGARPGPGADGGGAGAGEGHGQAPRAAQGGQPEAGRGDTEHAPARRPLMEPHRHDNRVALQQHPPDLHLGP